jgi:uncharacterized protein (DUF1330 family)
MPRAPAIKTPGVPLPFAGEADVAFYPSCQWGVPKSPIIAMGSTGAVGRHHTSSDHRIRLTLTLRTRIRACGHLSKENSMKRYIGLGIAMFAGAAIGAAAVSGLHAQAKLKAYSVTEQEVIDASALPAYTPAVQAALKAAGGHILDTGGKVVAVMGAAPPQRVIINEWDSVEQAQAFYKSKAYNDLVPQRDKAMKVSRVYVVETVK